MPSPRRVRGHRDRRAVEEVVTILRSKGLDAIDPATRSQGTGADLIVLSAKGPMVWNLTASSWSNRVRSPVAVLEALDNHGARSTDSLRRDDAPDRRLAIVAVEHCPRHCVDQTANLSHRCLNFR